MVNYFRIDQRYYFVDLPGYGYAKVSLAERERWAALMDDYFRHLAAANAPRALLVLLIDGKVAGTDLDVQAHDYVTAMGHRPVIVATKIDKVPRGRRKRQLGAIRQRLSLPEAQEVHAVSATTGEGVVDLWKAIGAFLDDSPQQPRGMDST